MYGAMCFWLEKGVDGFRMDVLWLLIKDKEFRNNPPNPEYHDGMRDFASTLPVYNANRPETHEVVAEMRGLMDSYGPTLPEYVDVKAAESTMERRSAQSHRVLIGEIYLPLPELVTYYGLSGKRGPAETPAPETPELNGANLPFNFHLILTRVEGERDCGDRSHVRAVAAAGRMAELRAGKSRSAAACVAHWSEAGARCGDAAADAAWDADDVLRR